MPVASQRTFGPSPLLDTQGKRPPSPASEPQPLSEEETARADLVARRLHAVLHTLVESLPKHARGASGMARHLSVVRNTCQRVVTAVAEPQAAAQTLARFPGVQGLQLLIQGFRGVGEDEANVAAALAAVEQYDQLIRDLAGSQSKLVERLNAVAPVPGRVRSQTSEAAEIARQRLFAAAAEVAGRRCEVNLSLYAFRLHPQDRGQLERVLVTGQIGQVATPDAMPFAFTAGDTHYDARGDAGRAFVSLDKTPAHGHTPAAVLEAFSSDPLPVVTSRGSKGQLVQTVDHRSAPRGESIDVVVANRSVHPARVPGTKRPTLDEVWVLVNYPSRHLIFDVYLHRDMERMFRPSIDVQLWGPNLDTHPADRWLTRFPCGPRLELLGAGLQHARSDGYARHAELTAHLFERVGWKANEFVGFRCEVAYPVWRAGYCMGFEYTPNGN